MTDYTEQARTLAQQIQRLWYSLGEGDIHPAEILLTQALRKAVQAERERCALVAYKACPEMMSGLELMEIIRAQAPEPSAQSPRPARRRNDVKSSISRSHRIRKGR